MAKKKTKSLLATKLGEAGRKAVEEHAGDETNYGASGELPAGIEGGVAQIVECKFDTYKKGANEGEVYFQARGVILTPKQFAGEVVEGRQTVIMEPICDTPTRSRKEINEHVEWVLNEFRKLGIETEGASIEDLEVFAETVKKEAPYFKFRTWKGEPTEAFPNPRTNEQWKGLTEPSESEEEEEDDVVVRKPRGTKHEETEPELEEESEPELEEESEGEETEDLIALGKAADNSDDKAAEKLQDIADSEGVDSESYDTWELLAEALTSDSEESDEGESDEDLAPPEVGETYDFKPPRARKAIPVEITAVFGKKETCNVKTEEGKLYKGVTWGKLII